MLDDFLRSEEDTASFLDEIEQETEAFNIENESNYGFLGMTPFQRFVLSALLLMMVFIIGSLCLLVTGSIAIPTL
jgi:hypothetical protein